MWFKKNWLNLISALCGLVNVVSSIVHFIGDNAVAGIPTLCLGVIGITLAVSGFISEHN